MLRLAKWMVHRSNLRGMLRLWAYFSTVALVGLFFTVRSAKADIERQAEDLGRKLVERLGPLVLGEPQALRVNGQELFVASTVTPLSPPEVIERMNKYCREHSGNPSLGLREMPRTLKGKELDPELQDPAAWLIAKAPADDELGHIACFARDDQRAEGFLDRVSAFMDTEDLASFGDFRYLAARRTDSGKTHVLALWTEGPFSLSKMFPDKGDSGGRDSPYAPRPNNAVRLLSAEASGGVYGLRAYESRDPPDRVLSFYDEQMRLRGFEPLAAWLERTDDEQGTATPSYARAFSKGKTLLLVSAIEEPVSGEGTQVNIIELGTVRRMHGLAVER